MITNILLADDSEAIQKVIKIAFSGYNVCFHAASTFVDATELSRQTSLDLIIADAQLTGTHKPTDFHDLLSLAPKAAIILLEGSYDKIDRTSFEKVGLTHFIKKPFESNHLIAYIKSHFKLNLTRGHSIDNTNYIPTPPTPTDQIAGLNGQDLIPPPPPSELLRAKEEPAIPPLPPLPINNPQDIKTDTHPFRASKEKGTYQKKVAADWEIIIRQELEKLLPVMIEQFCRNNFEPIAKRVIKSELQRLAEERLRHIIDN